jgi:hypothetical protein
LINISFRAIKLIVGGSIKIIANKSLPERGAVPILGDLQEIRP